MDARQRDVLVALIREYVDSAEPVGSRVLSKRHFPHLSPATIRNVMADLEEMGYLAQPHTSAGRIPTDKAYRFYVDSFPPPSAGGKPGSAALPTRRPGIDGFMERTSSHLSTATRLTGLLRAPALRQRRHQHPRPPGVLGRRADACAAADLRAEGAAGGPHDLAVGRRWRARHHRRGEPRRRDARMHAHHLHLPLPRSGAGHPRCRRAAPPALPRGDVDRGRDGAAGDGGALARPSGPLPPLLRPWPTIRAISSTTAPRPASPRPGSRSSSGSSRSRRTACCARWPRPTTSAGARSATPRTACATPTSRCCAS